MKGGYPKAYTPEKTAQYEAFVAKQYKAQNGMYFGQKPLNVFIRAYMEVPKSASKKAQKKMLSGIDLPTKKSDIDNITKSILDALNTVAYADDRQIIHIDATKFYSLEPRVEIEIEEIETICTLTD